MKKPELLIPASSLEVLKTAVNFGADAVYIGGEVFSLRAKSKNFSLEDMREGIDYAHTRGVRVFVTANILAHNRDLKAFEDYLYELKEIGPDVYKRQVLHKCIFSNILKDTGQKQLPCQTRWMSR